MADKTRYDLDGEEIITSALMDLFNSFPALGGEKFAYAVLSKDGGKAVFPASGSAIRSEVVDVTGHVTQICEYPLAVVYRANGLSESRKQRAKEWLDAFGKWLERQPVSVDGEDVVLEGYPALTRGREFTKIERVTSAYLGDVYEDKSEDWVINIVAAYRNEYDK